MRKSAPAAAPGRRRAFSRNGDKRVRGESYQAEVYDRLIEAGLAHVATSADLAIATVPLAVTHASTEVNPAARGRIERERQAATQRFQRDRDVTTLEGTFARLDEEERAASTEIGIEVTRDDVRCYLFDPSRLWTDTSTEERHAIAEGLFNRVDALGPDLVHPSTEAERYGWAETFGPDPIVCSIGQPGRGERN